MATAKCTICNEEYKICNSCEEQRKLKPWKSVTDTIEHYKIYLALHGYTLSKDKETAKKELDNCDLSGLENFNPEIKVAIKEIIAEPKKVSDKIKDNNKTSAKADANKESNIE